MKATDFIFENSDALYDLQKRTKIPALWVAAQFAHEGQVGDGTGSATELARLHNNWGGIKWREWQREFGCVPVTYGTWEVLQGETQQLNDAFCSCGSGSEGFARFLKVYEHLITTWYTETLPYASDPLLFGYMIWKGGWATDPNYLIATASWVKFMTDHFPLPPAENPVPPPAPKPVEDWKTKLITDLMAVDTPDGHKLLNDWRNPEAGVKWWELAAMLLKVLQLRRK